MTSFEKAKAGLKTVFEAIPKGKFGQVFQAAQDLEGGVGQMASMLNALRKYFIETTGEESPFVKKIDQLVPRPKADTEK